MSDLLEIGTDGIDHVRAGAGRLLNCPARNIAFLKCTSEGIDLVARGIDWRPGDLEPAWSASAWSTLRTGFVHRSRRSGNPAGSAMPGSWSMPLQGLGALQVDVLALWADIVSAHATAPTGKF